MKKRLLPLIIILMVMITFSFTTINQHGNTETCKVLLENISGEYSGGCKDGLAHGRGRSSGIDTYRGNFKDGLPHGRGTYTYSNGDRFKGYWMNGMKHGRGTFRFTENGRKRTLRGYWRNGVFAGTTNPDVPYRVVSSTGILSHRIVKSELAEEGSNEVILTIRSAFQDFVPQDLRIDKSSGQILQTGGRFRINQFFLPFHCEINYTILVGQSRRQCSFVFDILEPGSYTVTLSND